LAKQKTKTGHAIPIPKRGDFIRDLEKAAEKAAEKPPKKSRRGKGRKKD
jgi:hypothetical protein